jgi:hypothetical protein
VRAIRRSNARKQRESGIIRATFTLEFAMKRPVALLVGCALLCATANTRADEGMWTYDNFPVQRVREQYGAEISPQWLDRVRRASVRLSNCSASFVSEDGLILTNHHCVTACLAQNSTRERSFVEEGFLATDRAREMRCGTQVADVLVEMQDITADVAAAVRGLDAEAAGTARKAALARLEQTCTEDARKRSSRRRSVELTPDLCESVTLYNGGQYFLYKYRRYTDVRVAFAPEAAIGAFGGDPDNFQFPRWCLDMALLRAYEGGKPVKVAAPLRIDFNGPAAGELVFVSGHPGGTDRLLTVAELQLLRDREMPQALLRASELRGRYIQFGKSSGAARRIVQEPLGNLENGIKVRRKLLDALHDDALFEQKRRDEADLRQRSNALLGTRDPWAETAAATKRAQRLYERYTFLEGGAGFNSQMFRWARALVRAAAERPKPNAERLREYSETAIPAIQQRLLANVPVYDELEQLTLSFSLERMREWLGPDEPLVRRLLATESPDALAERVVTSSRLRDPAERRRLWEGGQAAIDASTDPMVVLARSVDAESRAVRSLHEREVEAPIESAAELLAAARFAAYGTQVYPDATFTLRLNYGTVQGWMENGTAVEPFTRLSRLYERATGADPFALPKTWLDARDRLDPTTPFNLSTNNDIVGGNSGSPLVNARGDVVGLVFDGNIHSISGSYWFDTARNRSVAVHTAIMKAALTQVYDAQPLFDELSRRRSR